MKFINKKIFLAFSLFLLITIAFSGLSEARKKDDNRLKIPDELRKCESNDDCTWAVVDCLNACNGFSALNKKHDQLWHKMFKEQCPKTASSCAFFQKPTTICYNGICEFGDDLHLNK